MTEGAERTNRVGLPPIIIKVEIAIFGEEREHDELLGNALEAFSKPRTRDAAHLAARTTSAPNLLPVEAARSIDRKRAAAVAGQIALSMAGRPEIAR